MFPTTSSTTFLTAAALFHVVVSAQRRSDRLALSTSKKRRRKHRQKSFSLTAPVHSRHLLRVMIFSNGCILGAGEFYRVFVSVASLFSEEYSVL